MSKKHSLTQLITDRVASKISGTNHEADPRRLDVEALEPRVLFSGSPAPAPEPAPAAEAAPPAAIEAQPAETPELSPAPTEAPVETTHHDSTPAVSTIPPASEETTAPVNVEESQLATIVEAATQRWIDSGISTEQADALASATYLISDLDQVGVNILGSTEDSLVTIDDDAAGRGWFVDSTPNDDSEFSINSPNPGTSSTQIDLLSIVLHEQGHLLGLDGVEGSGEADNIMNGVFVEGERRLPEAGQAEGAVAGSLEGVHYATTSFQEGVAPTVTYAQDAVYIRSDSPGSNSNGDTDQEIIVGFLGSGDELRGLLEFDISSIDPADVIDSVSLILRTESPQGGQSNNITINVYEYGFDIDETSATWNAPAAGDATAGGTSGTLLTSATFNPSTNDIDVTFGDSGAFRTAVSDALANDGILRLLVARSDNSGSGNRFARFDDETVTTAGNRPELIIESTPAATTNIVTPSSATATSTISSGGRVIGNTIDGSGLSSGGTSGDILNETHTDANSNSGPYWLSGPGAASDPNFTLEFTLPAPSDIDSVHQWVYTRNGETDRGLRTFDISFSTDGVNFGNTISAATLGAFDQPPAVTDYLPQTKTFTLQTGVTHVRLSNIINFGDGSYMGLSEIRFSGPAAGTGGFVAYHDLGGETVDAPGAFVTDQGNDANQTIRLVNYADNADTGIDFTITGANGSGDNTSSAHRYPDAGTDAASLFGTAASPIVTHGGSTFEGGNGGSGATTFTLSGLIPSKLYDIAIYGDRDASADGVERFTLGGADGAVNSSSAYKISSTVTDMETRPNAETGYVARWSDIRPGADGIVTIEIDPEVTSVSNIAYLTALRVEETGNAPGPPAPTELTAFHDFGGEPSPGNITTQQSLSTTHTLIDFATGVDTGIELSVAGANGLDTRTGTVTLPPGAGTPAGDLFLASGIDLDDGLISEGGNGGSGSTTLTLSGLDPTYRYDVSLYGDRNATADGVERFTLGGADGATNSSSTGIAGDFVTDLDTRTNAAAGDVARWTDIDPGADGIITIEVDPEFTSPSNIAYLSALRLSATPVVLPTPLASESFLTGTNAANGEYTTSGRITGTNPTIDGFSGTWSGNTGVWIISDVGLTHPSIVDDAGGSAEFFHTSDFGGDRSAQRALTLPPSNSEGEVWVAGLVQLLNPDPDATGYAYAGFGQGTWGTNGPVSAETEGLLFGVEGDGTNMDLVFRHRTGGGQMTSDVLVDGITAGETQLVVMKVAANTIVGGTNGNDAVSIWVNPTNVSSEAAMGAAMEFEDFSAQANSTAFTDIMLGGNSGLWDSRVRFDELAIGYSLEEVVTSAAASEPDTTVSIVGGNLIIEDTNGASSDDQITIRVDAGGTDYLITDGNSLNETVAIGSFSGDIIVESLAGQDTLTVDYSGGNFSHDIQFDGGDPTSSPGDELVVTGGNFGTVTHNLISGSDGNLELGGNTITYTGLEPVDMTGSTATDFIFNLPTGADNARLSDQGGFLRLESTDGVPTFELTDFVAPSGSITINGGTDDTLDISTALTLSGVDLTVTNVATDLDQNINLGSGDLTFDGDVTQGAAGVTLAANSITFGGTTTLVTGNSNQFSLNAASGGVTNSSGNLFDLNGGRFQLQNGTTFTNEGDMETGANLDMPLFANNTNANNKIINEGTLDINGSQLRLYVEITNTASGTININNPSGTAEIEFKIPGSASSPGGLIRNQGIMNLAGGVDLHEAGTSSGSIINESGGILNFNTGLVTVSESAKVTNESGGVLNIDTDVTIDAGTTFTNDTGGDVNFDGGAFTITLNGSTAELTNDGNVTWLAGQVGNKEITGSGTFVNNGTFDHNHGGTDDNIILSQTVTFENNGNFDFTNQGDIDLEDSAEFVNNGLLEKTVAGSDPSFVFTFGTTGGTFTQTATGTVRSDAGRLRIATGDASSDAAGTWNANGGDIELAGEWTGTLTGTASGSGQVLITDSGNAAVMSDFSTGAGGVTFDIDGNGLVWDQETIDATAGTFTNVDTMTIIAGGVKVLTGGELVNDAAGTLTHIDGTITLDGASILRNQGTLEYSGGNLKGYDGTGSVVIDSGATANHAGSGELELDDSATYANDGTFNWSGGGDVILTNAANSFHNAGTFNYTDDSTNTAISGAGTFTNDGTFNHVADGSGDNVELRNSITFENNGSYDFQGGGDLEFFNSALFVNSGTLEKTAAGTSESLVFTRTSSTGGSFEQTATGTVRSDAGSLRIATETGTSDAAGSWNANGGDIALAGEWTGTITGTGSGSGNIQVTDSNNGAVPSDFAAGAGGVSFDIDGDGLVWESQSIDTTNGDVTILDQMTIQGAGTKTLLGAGVLDIENGGTVTIANATVTATGGGEVEISNGGTLQGSGTITALIDGKNSATIITQGDLSLGDVTANAFSMGGTTIVNAGDTLTANDSGIVVLGQSTVVDGTLTKGGGGTDRFNLAGGDVLSGTGTVTSRVLTNTGSIAPGNSGPGQLTILGGIDMINGSSNGTLTIDIDGTAGAGAAGGHDQLVTTGNVDVTGGILDLNFAATPAAGSSFTIIDGDTPVVGEFAGIGDEEFFTASGNIFHIDYQGGDGNDVVLTSFGVGYIWDGGGTDNNWSTAANWVGDMAPVDNATFDTIVFAGTARLSPVSDAGNGTGGYNTNDVIFAENAGAFTLEGPDPLDMLGRDPIGDLSEIINYSSATQTINLDLFHRTDRNTGLVFDARAGDIVVNGNVLDLGGTTDDVTVTGNNTVTFNGSNDYQDPTVVGSAMSDTFESYPNGNVRDTSASAVWDSNGSGLVDIESQSGNKFLSFGWNGASSRGASRALAEGTIDDGATGIVSFEARVDNGDGVSYYGVATGDPSGSQTQNAAGQIIQNSNLQAFVGFVDGAGSTVDLVASDGTTGGQTTLQTGLSINTWYSIEMVIDNDSGTYDVLLDGSQVGTGVSFREGSANADLTHFVVIGKGQETAGSGGANNAGHLDNLVVGTQSTLLVNGTHTGAGDYTVDAGSTLGGTGSTTGAVNITGGTIAPGDGGTADLGTGSLTLDGNSTASFGLNGSTPDSGHDQIDVTGTVDLGNAILDLTLGYAPGANDAITIISNDSTDAVTGTFAGLADGDTVTVGGEDFRIFYGGGDGNDVILVEATPPSVVYVDDSFTQNPGQTIIDADLGENGNQGAIFAVNAFANVNDALAAVAGGGTIIVNDGDYNETASLTGGVTLKVTGPDVPGTAMIQSLSSDAASNIVVEGSSTLEVEGGIIAGVISGSGGVNIAGNTTLSAANTYDGETNVNAGTLTITNASGLGNTVGGTTVAGGATLTIDLIGSQTVAEDLAFNADGTGRATLRVDNPGGQITTLSGNLETNSTGANLVQWNSQGGGTVRYTGDITGDLNNSLLFLRNNSTHEVLGSVNLTNGGDIAITDGATVEIGAAGKTYDWDNTTVAFGTLTTNIDDLLPSATNLTLGQSNGSLPGNLDLNGTDQTVNNVSVISNNATPNTITIDTGNSLTVDGNFVVGRTGTGQVTNLTAAGGGDLVVNGATFKAGVGNSNQGGTENSVTVDLTGLGSFTADVTNFQVGSHDPGANTTASRIRADLLLSDTANTITANLLTVGDSGNRNARPANLTLGAGTNEINANLIEVGRGKGNGTIEFAPTDTTGTVTIRGAAGGSSAANIVVGANTVTATGATTTGLIDLENHDADIVANAVTLANRTQSNGGVSGTIRLGSTGTAVSINTLTIADRTNGGNATGIYTQSGGTLTVGTGTQDLLIGRNRTNGGATSSGTMDVSGADSVTLNVDDLRIGLGGPNTAFGYGDLILSDAGTNTITATTITVGDSAGTGNTGDTSTLQLGGAANTINADTFTVGARKSNGRVTIDTGGTLTLGGKSGAEADLLIANNRVTTGVSTSGTMDLSGGTFNATLDEVVVGIHGTGNGSGVGNLTFDAGAVAANSVLLANTSATGTSNNPENTIGTINQNGGTFTVSGAVSEGGGNSAINVNDGTMTIGNGLEVDNLVVGFNNEPGAALLTVNGGAVEIGENTGDDLIIGRSTIAGTDGIGTLDLRNASSVTINVGDTLIGTMPTSANPGGRAHGTLQLSMAGANTVTSANLLIGDSPGAGNTAFTSTIELGGSTNTFAVNQFTIGNRKSQGAVTSDAGGSFTLTGTGGAGTGTLDIARRTVNTGANGTGLLDLSDASSVDINVSTIRMGTITSGGGGGNSVGTWNFSDTGANVVTANSVLVADSSAAGNTNGPATTINLGQDNTVNVNTFTVGGRKSQGVVNIDAGGTLTLQGQGGAGTEADLFVGNNSASNTGTNNDGIFDMTGGTINATIDQLTVGRYVGTTGSGSGNGEFTMEAGTVTANSLLLGSSAGSNAGNTDGIFNLNGGILDLQNGPVDDGGGTAAFNFGDATLRDVDTFGFDLDQDNGTGLLQIGPDMTIDDMTVNGDYTGAAGGVLEIGLDGEAGAGVAGGHDQLIVNGAVTLDDLTLDLQTASALTITPGSTFVLIDNDGTDPVVGEFVGLAEGTIVSLAIPNPGTPPPAEIPSDLFQISYKGGTGNDVVLTGLGVDATTNIWLDGTGNLHIEDIDGEDTKDNLTIRVEGTEVVISDPDNALGTLITGATQTAVGEVRVDTSLFGGDIIVETRGEADVINIGSLGDAGGAPGAVIPGGLIVDGGDAFDTVDFLLNTASILTDDSSVDVDAEKVMFTLADLTVGGIGSIDLNATDPTSASGGTMTYNGLWLYGSDLEATGTGTITLAGEGGDTGTNNSGIKLTNGSEVTTADGDIDIDGTGGGDALFGTGVALHHGASVSAGGDGDLTIDGTGGTGTGLGEGVFFGADTGASVADGDLTITGTATGDGSQNQGVDFTGATLEATGTGAITVTGSGSGSGTNNIGLSTTATDIATTTGTVTLTGTGGTGTSNNQGVRLASTDVTTAGGSIDIDGQGNGTGSGVYNTGVQLAGTTLEVTAGAGTIDIDGTAGDGTALNDGVQITAGSAVTTETGAIGIRGTGMGAFTGNRGANLIASTVGSTSGDITILGTGSEASTAVLNDGVSLSNSHATTAGTLKIAGTGGTGSLLNNGVKVVGGSLSGVLDIDGIGGGDSATGSSNAGVYILNSDLTGALGGSAVDGTGGFGGGLNLGAYMQGTMWGALTTDDVTTDPNEEDEKGGNFFPAILPLALMAGANGRSQRAAHRDQKGSQQNVDPQSFQPLVDRALALSTLPDLAVRHGDTFIFTGASRSPEIVDSSELDTLLGIETKNEELADFQPYRVFFLTEDPDGNAVAFSSKMSEEGRLATELAPLFDFDSHSFFELLNSIENGEGAKSLLNPTKTQTSWNNSTQILNRVASNSLESHSQTQAHVLGLAE